jgi:UDP-N-acetylglucosamine--dolichyl-phosphate N-acetylglucosaminephosphotransferase
LISLFLLVPLYDTGTQLKIIAAGTTVLLAGLVGMADDAVGFPWRVKSILPVLASIPLAVMRAGMTSIHIPFIAVVDLGILYYLLVIPIAVTASANVVNQLAGLNGLEAGSCLVVGICLMCCTIAAGNQFGLVLLAPYVGALLAFLWYNRYPSRVFPGDVGTLAFGAAFAAFGVLCNLEQAVLICLIPHILNSILILLGFLRGAPPESVMKDDLIFHSNSSYSLRCLILRWTSLREQSLVASLLLIVAFFGLLSIFSVGR